MALLLSTPLRLLLPAPLSWTMNLNLIPEPTNSEERASPLSLGAYRWNFRVPFPVLSRIVILIQGRSPHHRCDCTAECRVARNPGRGATFSSNLTPVLDS